MNRLAKGVYTSTDGRFVVARHEETVTCTKRHAMRGRWCDGGAEHTKQPVMWLLLEHDLSTHQWIRHGEDVSKQSLMDRIEELR